MNIVITQRRGLALRIALAVGAVVAAGSLALAGVAAAAPPPTPGLTPTSAPTPASTSTPAAGGAAAADVVAPCGPAARACVQLSTQHAWLLQGGRVVDDGFITSGADGMDTPTGIFHVQWKDKTHYSSEYHAAMPNAVFFDTHGDALHEGSLERQSAGCVHLDHDTAATFFAALQPGDPVQILP